MATQILLKIVVRASIFALWVGLAGFKGLLSLQAGKAASPISNREGSGGVRRSSRPARMLIGERSGAIPEAIEGLAKLFKILAVPFFIASLKDIADAGTRLHFRYFARRRFACRRSSSDEGSDDAFSRPKLSRRRREYWRQSPPRARRSMSSASARIACCAGLRLRRGADVRFGDRLMMSARVGAMRGANRFGVVGPTFRPKPRKIPRRHISTS